MRTGILLVHVGAFKKALQARAEEVASALLDQVRAQTLESNSKICNAYAIMNVEIMKTSDTGEEALALKKYIQKCGTEQEQLEASIKMNKDREEFLTRYMVDIPEDDFRIAIKAYEWPKKMVATQKEARDKANAEHRAYEQKLKDRRAEFCDRLSRMDEEIHTFETESDIDARAKLAEKATDLNTKLKDAQVDAEEINTQEVMFAWPKTKFDKIAQMINKLDPFNTLWSICLSFHASYQVWMNGPFSRLVPETIENDVGDMFRKIYKLVKVFSGATGLDELPEPTKVAMLLKERIESFKNYLPLISAICNAGLRDRHWTKMSDLCGFEVKRDDHTSLSRLLERRLDQHTAALSEISDFASREFSFEKILDKMLVDWDGVRFELAPWKATGTFILKGGPVDEAQALLDDHIVKTQAMKASPFAKVFSERINPWEKKLVRLQDILDEWLKCQGKWLYLEPIFGSAEIMMQIPREGAAFQSMNTTWHKIMKKTHDDPVLLNVAEFENLLEDLRSANECLDIVEKGLNDFLDTKKMAFPRFFFLSNDELLEILSEAKDPLKIQPFMKKLVEAVSHLEFVDNKITAMFSVEGERIQLDTPVDPAAIGPVEKWLTAIEEQMQGSLRTLFGQAIESYATTPREKWILVWPGQLVLGASQVYWTQEVNTSIVEGGSRGLKAYGDKCTQQLLTVVQLVRGQLSKLERATLGALVVIDVHARDVVVQMSEEGVETDKDFKWLSQLRYYWEEGTVKVGGIG